MSRSCQTCGCMIDGSSLACCVGKENSTLKDTRKERKGGGKGAKRARPTFKVIAPERTGKQILNQKLWALASRSKNKTSGPLKRRTSRQKFSTFFGPVAASIKYLAFDSSQQGMTIIHSLLEQLFPQR